jgi:hypothetical protein
MNKSPKSKSEALVHDLLANPLELPDGEFFSSVAPKLDAKEMFALSERYLPIINARPDFIERKIREAFDVPFSL